MEGKTLATSLSLLACKRRNINNNLAHGRNISKIRSMNCVLIKNTLIINVFFIELLSTIRHHWVETSTTPPCLPRTIVLTTSPSIATIRQKKLQRESNNNYENKKQKLFKKKNIFTREFQMNMNTIIKISNDFWCMCRQKWINNWTYTIFLKE
jgi:hypothetical protein